ncbi:ATP-binding protein [Roseiflexus castenholzii]|uniref:histidine kinase n=1 Tax=Roseiflexus castenholzii (strain DSM 13941 / HLO8) TaxID=383372 RepID=A7NNM7_ROSCS|nr:ATP-binding protein [Roseiflexus castenholzii]ABU59168.1 multi-sensor signal transduction histidine kinase [Roseiflexus castenholzii DSM 13941]
MSSEHVAPAPNQTIQISALIRRLYQPTAIASAITLTLTSIAIAMFQQWSLSTLAIGVGLAILLLLCDRFPVRVQDRWRLTPAPVVLVAGAMMTAWSPALIATLVGSLLSTRRPWQRTVRIIAIRTLIVSGVALMAWVVPATPPLVPSLALALLVGAGYLLEALFDTAEMHWSTRLRHSIVALPWYVPVMALHGALFGAFWPAAPEALPFTLALLGCVQFLARNQARQGHINAELTDLREQLSTRTERLERLQALATAMLATLDDRRQLQLLCERLAALLDAEAGWVALDDNDALRVLAVHRLTLERPDLPLTDQQWYREIMQRGQITMIAGEHILRLAPPITSDDPMRWSTLLALPLRTDHGALGVICLAFDHLRGLNSDDQRILTSFTRQAAVAIENTRLFTELRQKQAELIQSSKLAAVGTFAAGIGHEFNNLLGGMLGYAELGRSTGDIAEKDHALDVIRQACQRGRVITSGLLTFARRSEHRREVHHLADIIAETLTLVEVDLRKLNITLARHIEPTPSILCDGGQIAQVLLNLVTNARDAIGQNGGTITVSLRQCDEWVELSVLDTGGGIPEHVRDRIFEPFVTTKGALGASSTPGTGLGLSVSYGIIKDHGGDIQFETETGVGTNMIVRLPIHPPSSQ